MTINEPVQRTCHSIHIGVDPHIELMSVIQTVSRYRNTFPFLLNGATFPYGQEVHDQFAPYADQPAVQMFDEVSLQPRMFNFMAPPTTMLYLTADLTLREDLVWPETLLQRIGGRDRLETFAGHLRSFHEMSSFGRFYAAHTAYYERLIDGVVASLGARDYVQELEAFYGMHQSSYNLVLVSLYGHVGFGPYLDTLTGERHIYNILGPQRVQEDVPTFGDERYFCNMQRHEFSHSFINPLTDQHWEQASSYAYVYDALPPQKVCGEWSECVNEYIIRAITTYLAFQDSREAGEAALAAEKARNVVFIDELLASIGEYAQNRDRYPTLDDYYPRLLETFAQ
jgi:hypothetical protein